MWWKRKHEPEEVQRDAVARYIRHKLIDTSYDHELPQVILILAEVIEQVLVRAGFIVRPEDSPRFLTDSGVWIIAPIFGESVIVTFYDHLDPEERTQSVWKNNHRIYSVLYNAFNPVMGEAVTKYLSLRESDKAIHVGLPSNKDLSALHRRYCR